MFSFANCQPNPAHQNNHQNRTKQTTKQKKSNQTRTQLTHSYIHYNITYSLFFFNSPAFLSHHKNSTMLPYKTIGEAESLLNRTLTFSETLWLNYSANKSDYFLFCHNILFLFVIFSLIPVPLVVAELMRATNIERYKIQPKVRLSFAEMISCYKTVMKMFFFVVGPLQLVSYPSVKVNLLKFLIFFFCFV